MAPRDLCQTILQNIPTTTAEALALFESLEPATVEFMFGLWQGYGMATHHPLDGLLEASNWYGKEFISPEIVHPLLFSDHQGKLFKVAPSAPAMKMVLKMPFLKQDWLQPLLKLTPALLETKTSQARLRMMAYRGQVTATMIYDYLPINDSFKKIDNNAVLGVMDYKEISQPFFFVLKRCPQECNE
jgi:hypothetical protein